MEYKVIQILSMGKNKRGINTMAYVPTTIADSNDIESITPFVSAEGRLFKNVSVIETRGNKIYTITGNHVKIANTIFKKNIDFKGF